MKVKKGNPLMMGCHKLNKSYHFAVTCKSTAVKLLIYENADFKLKFTVELDDSYKTGDVFACEISDVGLERCSYCYEAEWGKFIDPYARTISECQEFGIEQENALHLSRIAQAEYDWGKDQPLQIPYADSVIYKLNVRGFTKSRTSGVRHKGTFAGVIEKIPYLKSLGITTLELMPAYEFDEMNRFPQLHIDHTLSMYSSETVRASVNYWGYTNAFYYAPKASFSSVSKHQQDYTSEMKDMVKTLHANGIEVIMEMFFTTETPAMILDCLRFWVTEYHLDGIHLYASETALNVASSDPLLSKTKLLTVYWNGEAFDYKHMGNYNDGFKNTARKFLKGDENQLAEFVEIMKSNPLQSANINYITNHNGFTLMDLVSFDRKHNEANHENNQDGEDFNYSWNCGVEGKSRKKKIVELRRKQMKNAWMMLLLAQGTPLILAGDEFENTQGGNNNPYCIDGETTWLNWKNSDDACQMQDFVRELIQFRKQHKILHMDKQLYAYDQLSCGFPDISYHGSSAWFNACENYNRHIGMMYCQKYSNQEDCELIYVAYNMHWESHELALPKIGEHGDWSVVMCSSDKADAVKILDNRLVKVPERCTAVLKGFMKGESVNADSVKVAEKKLRKKSVNVKENAALTTIK